MVLILKSHTVIIHIQLEITNKRIHKFTNTINIDIAIYNLQHTSSCIIYMHIKFSYLTNIRSNKSNIIYIIKSFNKRYLLAGGRGLGPPLEDYFL
jgi:hypothetical protein